MAQEGAVTIVLRICRAHWFMRHPEPLRTTSSHCAPGHPASQSVRNDQGVSNPRSSPNSVSKDVEHVMAIVRQSKWVDDSIVADDGYREYDSSDEVKGPEEDLGAEHELEDS